MGMFDHSSRSAFVRSGTDVDENAWLTVSAQFIPNVFNQVDARTLCRPVKFLHPKLAHPCIYGPCLVHWCTVMLEQEGAHPKLSLQNWEHEIVQNVLVC